MGEVLGANTGDLKGDAFGPYTTAIDNTKRRLEHELAANRQPNAPRSDIDHTVHDALQRGEAIALNVLLALKGAVEGDDNQTKILADILASTEHGATDSADFRGSGRH
ncbi:hypothetical protein [Catellatospora citrea]|uniref:Uncharacterized protein n=1 Tax=Catellatospora citrea TaxID=53366 RepID=A0A8J3P3R1_9ACTN|nr:hypothetical protein [Catellatospora citrea]RKE10669.1 hypothetical protein C8E86_5585 [Catellatospora citrea]GIG03078.1 hypothetical protein Cci01nite_81710 [Catellatospora citrea]